MPRKILWLPFHACMMNKEFYVYIYFDPTRNNEPFYVGKGKGKRAFSHLDRTDPHPFTSRLNELRRKGVEPVIEVLDNLTDEEAIEMEIAFIADFGRLNKKTGTLLNLTDGGEGMAGYVMSEEHKRKIGDKHKGMKRTDETRANISKANKGKVRSEESRANISAAHKGLTLTEEHKNRIREGGIGRTLTEEHKRKISEAHKGKKMEKNPFQGKTHSEETKEKIRQKLRLNAIKRREEKAKAAMSITQQTEDVA